MTIVTRRGFDADVRWPERSRGSAPEFQVVTRSVGGRDCSNEGIPQNLTQVPTDGPDRPFAEKRSLRGANVFSTRESKTFARRGMLWRSWNRAVYEETRSLRSGQRERKRKRGMRVSNRRILANHRTYSGLLDSAARIFAICSRREGQRFRATCQTSSQSIPK